MSPWTLDRLGITDVYCSRYPGTGKVHLTMAGDGGMVDEQGESVPVWVGDFLSDPKHSDVLRKVMASGAMEKHAFIFVTLDAPWPVVSYRTSVASFLPTAVPALPIALDAGLDCVHSWNRSSAVDWLARFARAPDLSVVPLFTQ
jgi:hypothetical protein